jgi:cytochrome b6-f complex iron-sulfur subunit
MADPTRRDALGRGLGALMVAGVATAYGAVGAIAVRYLYPAAPATRRWMFVTELSRLAVGEAMDYTAPDGNTVTVARRTDGDDALDFVALSTICPHLGCKVHWEAHNERFFCPCHNGVFAPSGEALAGPPAEAGQRLSEYPLQVQDGMLFIEVPVESLGRPA